MENVIILVNNIMNNVTKLEIQSTICFFVFNCFKCCKSNLFSKTILQNRQPQTSTSKQWSRYYVFLLPINSNRTDGTDTIDCITLQFIFVLVPIPILIKVFCIASDPQLERAIDSDLLCDRLIADEIAPSGAGRTAAKNDPARGEYHRAASK